MSTRRRLLTHRILIVLALALSLALTAGHVLAEDRAERKSEIDANADAALEKLFAERPAARELYNTAAGYAVFTATRAGGLVVTGGGGTGVAVDKATGQRTYMRMGSGGVGLGVGAQRYDLIILFETGEDIASFAEGGWDASATAQAAAGRDGVAVSSSFVDGLAFFQLTERGLMAQADVSGTRFWVAESLN
jgi:lipid-binding SYLF domain-containing protein